MKPRNSIYHYEIGDGTYERGIAAVVRQYPMPLAASAGERRRRRRGHSLQADTRQARQRPNQHATMPVETQRMNIYLPLYLTCNPLDQTPRYTHSSSANDPKPAAVREHDR
jgi:hypothetical protein